MAVINFLVIAFVVFMLVRYVNNVKEAAEKKEEEVAVDETPAGQTEIELLGDILTALKTKN